ncbi:MAG: 4'-phosphopantetheinyl transferase family protein [Chthoniobacterales bacterium]
MDAPAHVLRARISARRLVDAVLPRYLGGTPDSLILSRDPNGRPYVAGVTLDFNLSHSGDWALLAVASGTRVGVDVEQMRRDRDVRAIARRYFSHSEAQGICDLADDDVARGEFYRLWTVKEAALKALGIGIANGLADTTLNNESHVRLPDGSEMRFSEFVLEPGYPAALVAQSQHELHLRFFHL